MSELPHGWRRARLGDLLRIRYGKSLDASLRRDDGPVPVLGSAGHMTGTHSPLVLGPAVVIGRKGNVGAVQLVLDSAWPIDTTFYAAIPPDVEPRFLAHQLGSLNMVRLDSSTTTPSLRREDLEAELVVLPPPADQTKIVEILESHFSRLDVASDLLRAASRHSRRLRSAFGDDLMKQGWPPVPIVDAAHFVTDGDHNPPKRVPKGVPHITAKCIRDGKITLTGCTHVSEDGYRQTARRYAPAAGDLIVTCVGTIGAVAVVPSGLRFSADRNLIGIRLDRLQALPDFVALVLDSHRVQQQMKEASSSTAQPHLYLKDLRQLMVPLPSLAVQQSVVDSVGTRLEQALAASLHIEVGQRRVRSLRRALFVAAFTGRLTAGVEPERVAEEFANV